MTYDWIAALVFVATLVAMTMAGRFLAFKNTDLQRMRELNNEADKPKMDRKRFREAVKINNKCGMYTNLGFYLIALPFCVSLESRPLWRHAVDIFLVLAIYDFMYYLTHRFIFHGPILRKVHSLHHQARKPTYIDALYVHPLETFIGLSLFLVSLPIVAVIGGAPLNAFSAAIATLLFTQLNTINHTWTKLPAKFPFNAIDYITGVHAAHHVDMNHGNYATITMAFDKLFGTYEEPVRREAA